MVEPQQRGERAELYVVAALASLASLAAFLFFFLRGEIMLYGDAVAHMNIARRVVDARDPGLGQLGTVWLPFPHLLQVPFLVNDWMWRTGIGGSIPSMIAYVLGVVGVYRILRARATHLAAWFGAAIYAMNPSLLYMQSTAMTESIFLATMIWAVVYLDEYTRALFPPHFGYGVHAELPAWKALERLGLVLAAAIMTRYDGWIFAFVTGLVAFALAMKWYSQHPSEQEAGRLARSMAGFLVLCALMPALWLAHNYKLSGRPLDWYNGPYSAKAIEQRTTKPGDAPYPGKNSMQVAAQHFVKAARMTMDEHRLEKVLILLALFGATVAALHVGHFGTTLLLWIPVPFYAYSIAYGSVPIFVPGWWPFSYYNTRYGLELLPAISLGIAIAAWSFSGVRLKRVGPVLSILVVVLVGFGYASSWRGNTYNDYGVKSPKKGPICYREAVVIGTQKAAVETWLAEQMRSLPPNATVLHTMHTIGAPQKAGIAQARMVNESTYMMWDQGLSAPFAAADYVFASDEDDVAKAVKRNSRNLEKVSEAVVHGIPVTLYRRTQKP